MKNMKASVAAFFELPLEEKKKYAMAANDVQGYGQTFVVSEEQKLEWCDMMFLIAHPSSGKNLKYWPLAIPGFKYVLVPHATQFWFKNVPFVRISEIG